MAVEPIPVTVFTGSFIKRTDRAILSDLQAFSALERPQSSYPYCHRYCDGFVEEDLVHTYFIQLPQDYKVVLLKNEFGDIEGTP